MRPRDTVGHQRQWGDGGLSGLDQPQAGSEDIRIEKAKGTSSSSFFTLTVYQ
jgi:hypothetical protein